jgi:CheY-like chemotaxis protein
MKTPRILNILVVEDDPDDLKKFRTLLRGAGPKELTGEEWDDLAIAEATCQADADSMVREAQYHIVLLDLIYSLKPEQGPEGEYQGMIWLPRLRSLQPEAAIVVLTAHGDVRHAVKAISDFHANDFVEKTESWEQIVSHIRDAYTGVPSFKQAEYLRHEYWRLLRSQALRVYVGELAKLIRQSRNGLDNIARTLESGDPTSVTDAPAQIRSASQALWDGFLKEINWVTGGVGTSDVASSPPSKVDLISDLIQPLPRLYGAEVRISDTTKAPIEISTYPADLRACLHEVVRNALEAHSETVEVSATREEGGAVITIRDDGDGLSPEVAEKLFEKGFTTHPDDPRHRGMGLFIASHLMTDLGGTIDVRPRDDGTRGVVASLSIPDLGGSR